MVPLLLTAVCCLASAGGPVEVVGALVYCEVPGHGRF